MNGISHSKCWYARINRKWKWNGNEQWKTEKNAIHTQKHNDFISPISHIQVPHKTWGMLISHWLPAQFQRRYCRFHCCYARSIQNRREWVKGWNATKTERKKNIENSIFFRHLGLALTMCLCIAWAFTHVVYGIQLQSTSMYFCKVRGRCLIQLIWLWSFSSRKCTSLALPIFSLFSSTPCYHSASQTAFMVRCVRLCICMAFAYFNIDHDECEPTHAHSCFMHTRIYDKSRSVRHANQMSKQNDSANRNYQLLFLSFSLSLFPSFRHPSGAPPWLCAVVNQQLAAGRLTILGPTIKWKRDTIFLSQRKLIVQLQRTAEE